MYFKKGIAVAMITGLVVFAGCGVKKEVKPQDGDRPAQQENRDGDTRKEGYVAEIDVMQAFYQSS